MVDWDNVKVHPAADALPMISGKDWDGFVDDIRQNGLRVPISMTPEGMLVDGRNRLKACKQLGIEPVHQTVTEDPILYVMTMNIHRRNLDASRKAALTVKLFAYAEREKAAERKAKGSSKGGRSKVLQKVDGPSVDYSDQADEPLTANMAMAKKGGVNHQYIATAKKLEKENPEAFEKLLNGEIKIADAAFILKKGDSNRGKILANEDLRKAQKWVSHVASVADLCGAVSVGAIRSDEQLRQHWVTAIDAAQAALKVVKKRIAGEAQ